MPGALHEKRTGPVPKGLAEVVAAAIRAISAQPDAAPRSRPADRDPHHAAATSPPWPRLLENAREDVLPFPTSLPPARVR